MGGNGVLMNGAGGQFSNVLSPDDLLALEGRSVLVDMSHPGLAMQASTRTRLLCHWRDAAP